MTEERKEEERKVVEAETNEPHAAAEGESDEQEVDEDAEQSDAGSTRSQTKLWIAIGIGVVIAVLLVMRRGSSDGTGEVGSTNSGDLTLVNADRNELDCATDKGIESYQCGFVDENQGRSVEEGKKLRPFMTVDRHLYLIPGLFLEPSVAQRYNTEPPNKPRGEQKRFTAKCKIKVVGELNNVKLRWSPTGTWEPPKKFPVATVSDCAIDG